VLAGNKKTREAVAGAGAQAASGAKELGQTATGAVAEVVADAARRILPSSMSGENDDRQGKRAGEDAAIPGNRPQEAQGHAGPAPRPLTIGRKAAFAAPFSRAGRLPGPRKHSPSRRKNVASRRARC
jgi:hypothetical protein